MEGERKYRQRGYQDTSRPTTNSPQKEDRPRPQGPKPSIDVTGPRLPRLVQAVTAARCFNCATMLPSGIDFQGNCPKCNAPLHCCKQCAHFEPSTRFQCLKPIPVRIASKDQANECSLFKPRVTVARDSAQPPAALPPFSGPSSNPRGPVAPPLQVQEPRNASDARTAFDNLFRKTEPSSSQPD